MKRSLKLILATVVLAFSFNSSFADEIIKLSINNGKLIIDRQKVTIHVGDKVTWEFDPPIKSFWFKGSSGINPFLIPLPGPTSAATASYEVTARYPNDPDGWTYHLAAHLTTERDVDSDPKIIVKPHKKILFIATAIIAALFMVLNIFLGFTVIKLKKDTKPLIAQYNKSQGKTE
jgi:hypothetical protein